MKFNIKNLFKKKEEKSKTDDSVYYVFNPAHGKPNVKYYNYETALYNAKKVARLYSDCTVYVLKIEAEINRQKVVQETKKIYGIDATKEEVFIDEIPF